MTSATGDTDNYDFDVALSFAGEDRDYVAEMNEALKAAGVKTFLDADYLAETWGEDLVEFFDTIYRKRARFAMLFISRHYAEKTWPRHERRSALARALEERGAYVLPVRLDDTEIEGLRPTLGYLDSRKTGIDGLVRAFVSKLTGRSHWPDGWPGDRVPRTMSELAQVRSERPPGWEYLYFAGLLHSYREGLEGEYLDHEMGYAPPSGATVDDVGAADFLAKALNEILRIVGSLMAMMEPGVQERAFGLPGVVGDPDRIERLALRWNAVYSELLNWAARIRGTSRPSRFNRAFELLARVASQPIVQYREFVDQFVASVDRVPSALAAKERLVIDLKLTLSIEEGVADDFNAELDAL